MDVSCFQCGGMGCKLCKGTGWIEVLGAGVVNKKVLEDCGIDTNEYSGFAFGIGIERIAMLKIRHQQYQDAVLSLICVLDQMTIKDESEQERISNVSTIKLVKRLCRY